MQDRLLRCVRDFLTLRLEAGRALLLAFSGGTDSMSLFLLLLECKDLLDFELHLAHVDHAYRPESREEAEKLKQLAMHFKLPFHQKRLEPMKGPNLEDRFRNERYRFFDELHHRFDFQAVLLAHHQDDQAETVLKRLCEGARLGALGGLDVEIERGNLTLWRPLLPIRKQMLASFLEKKKAVPIEDQSNQDTSFLRARMRRLIFPNLENHFGKQVAPGLARFGSLFQEIGEYFREKCKLIESSLISGPFGVYLEHPSSYSPLEMRFFLEEHARSFSAHLSQDSCAILLRLIEKKAAKGVIHAPPLTFVLNKGHLFILHREIPSIEGDEWAKTSGTSSWKEFWKGTYNPPDGEFKILALNDLDPVLRKRMKKWYSSHAVPPFFHDRAPIFWGGGEIFKEILTGQSFMQTKGLEKKS